MEYSKQFERDFTKRTLEIVRDYQGERDATLLINCLLGLLIVPQQRSYQRIPEEPLDKLKEWGISPESIQSFGGDRKQNLRQLVRSLRNAAAHFRITPLEENGRVKGFYFQDQNGFRAEIKLAEMRQFVEHLARHLDADNGTKI